MARFSADAAGQITQFLETREQEQQFEEPPEGTAYTLQLDEETNVGLIAAYNANSAQFSMNGGTLTQNGDVATINPPSLFYEGFQNAAAMLSKATSTVDPFTREEVARLMAVAFRIAGFN